MGWLNVAINIKMEGFGLLSSKEYDMWEDPRNKCLHRQLWRENVATSHFQLSIYEPETTIMIDAWLFSIRSVTMHTPLRADFLFLATFAIVMQNLKSGI